MKKALEAVDYKNQGSGIIYCASHREVENVCEYLDTLTIANVAYYSGLTDQEKNQNFIEWKTDEINIIVATSALGMGIDKNNVQWIIHSTISVSLTDFYQKSGRAGRNNENAKIVSCFTLQDRFRIQTIITGQKPKNNSNSNSNSNTNVNSKTTFKPNKPINIHVALKLINMWKLIAWNINQTICRKSLLINHFDDCLPYRECKNNNKYMCDILPEYHHESNLEFVNIYEIVYQLHLLLLNWDQQQRIYNRSFKSLYLILKGSREKTVLKYKDDRCSIYAVCKDWDNPAIQYFISKQLIDGYLLETHSISKHKGYVSYITAGTLAWKLIQDSKNYYIKLSKRKNKKNNAKPKPKPKKSPRRRSPRRKTKYSKVKGKK